MIRYTLASAAALLIASGAHAEKIPSHPDKIKYQELDFQPPSPTDHRRELASGVPVYMAKSDEFPLVSITLSFQGGNYMDPPGQTGLATVMSTMIRQGGTSSHTPAELDEELDFLAANVRVSSGATTTTATVNCLTDNLDDAFELFMRMVREPGFDAERLEVVRGQTLEGLKQRDDQGFGIAMRETRMALYGDNHFAGAQPTGDGVGAITDTELRGLHAQIFHPGNLIVSVVGDFDEAEMLAFLDTAFAEWQAGAAAPVVPDPAHTYSPGLHYYEKDQPQGHVIISQRSIQRDDPDAIAMEVMNDILGGNGFTSRIMAKVRTDEGLAYTAGSMIQPGTYYPGAFFGYYFSKSESVAFAMRLVMEEFDRIRSEPVTDDELKTAKNSIIETFPRKFENKGSTMRLFIDDERTARDEDYWNTYRDKVNAVTIEDVQRVAKAHLHPEEMIAIVVGPWEDIAPGNTDSEADPERVTTMNDLFGGKATQIPTRDPVTLEPIE